MSNELVELQQKYNALLTEYNNYKKDVSDAIESYLTDDDVFPEIIGQFILNDEY